MFISNPRAPHISLKPLNFALWFTLAFQAGAINVGGFITCHRFVTHVTGFATHFGIELTSGRLLEAISMLMVPIFFLIGCITSALIIDRQKYLGLQPHYTFAFSMMGFSFFGISVLGFSGVLGDFESSNLTSHHFFILASLAYLSGIQNSMISLASGLLVRTTHLTGITSDLGVGLMRMFYPVIPQEQKKIEWKMNLLRMGTILSFIFGSIAGGWVFIQWKYLGFLMPAMISLILASYSWTLNRPTKSHSSETPPSNSDSISDNQGVPT